MTSFPMPEGDPCFFCDIVAERAPTWQVIEASELTLTLLNGRQFEVGQCLIIPRRHAPSLLDLEDAEASAVMAAARRLSNALVESLAPDGLLLYQNNGVGSGQEVPHFHLHVVPRQPGSDWGFGPPHLERLEREGRLRHEDHRIVTEEKKQTVHRIQRFLE